MTNDNLETSYIPFQCMIINHISKFRLEGIPTAQYTILDILHAQGNKTTKELAELRGVSPSGISKLVKVLLAKGYVMQERDTNDRRCYDISITNKGIDFLERSQAFRNEVLEQIENNLNNEEIKQFCELCDKIVR